MESVVGERAIGGGETEELPQAMKTRRSGRKRKRIEWCPLVARIGSSYSSSPDARQEGMMPILAIGVRHLE